MTDEQRRVYVVTRGEYSDYHIVGIFDSRELAETCVRAVTTDHYGEQGRIEEHPINPHAEAMNAGLVPWRVRMEADGEVVGTNEDRRSINDELCLPRVTSLHAPNYPTHPTNGTLGIEVWARDQQHAVKIANEQRIIWLAEEPDRLPLLQSRRAARG